MKNAKILITILSSFSIASAMEQLASSSTKLAATKEMLLQKYKQQIITTQDPKMARLPSQGPQVNNTALAAAFISQDKDILVSTGLDLNVLRVKKFDGKSYQFQVETPPAEILGNYPFSTTDSELSTITGEKIACFDLETFRHKRTLTGHDNLVSSVDYDKTNPHILVSAALDNTMKLWDTRQSTSIETRITAQHCPNQAIFNPNGNQIAEAVKYGIIYLWDRRKLLEVEKKLDGFDPMAYNPNGTELVAVTCGDPLTTSSTITIYNTQTGNPITRFDVNGNRIRSEQIKKINPQDSPFTPTAINYSPDGVCVAWGVNGSPITKITANIETPPIQWANVSPFTTSCMFDKTSSRLLTASFVEMPKVSTVNIYDVSTQKRCSVQ